MTIKKLTVLVTGANGFVGQAICEHLRSQGVVVRGAVRGTLMAPYHVQSPSLTAEGDWTSLLQGVDVIVHCAARVHIMADTANNPWAAFRAVNTDGTLNLARQAASAGVKRFIFISTIKVNGEHTEPGHPFTEDIMAPPQDPYGLSKHEAEQGLLGLVAAREIEVTIIRPPLIYGIGVKANFASMIQWVYRGIPLPFGRINNLRSFLALPNLCDFVAHVLEHPAAANQIFLVADPRSLSTSQLLVEIAQALNVSPRLFYMPPMLLRILGCCFGIGMKLQRLCSSLEMDTRKAQSLLQWRAPFSLSQTLSLMVSFHRERF